MQGANNTKAGQTRGLAALNDSAGLTPDSLGRFASGLKPDRAEGLTPSLKPTELNGLCLDLEPERFE